MEWRRPSSWSWGNLKSSWERNPPRKEVIVAGVLGIVAVATTWITYRRYQNTKLASRNLEYAPYFSEDYHTARDKFREAVKSLVSEKNLDQHLVSFALPPRNATKAGDYSIDICYLPGSKSNKHLIIHVSGVHGVEGFAGSAIQIYLLRKVLPQLGYGAATGTASGTATATGTATGTATATGGDRDNQNKPHIVLVHALNPSGMAMNRRFTQDNIDLNRNVIFDDEQWHRVAQMDYTAEAEIENTRTTYKPNREYEKLAWFISNGQLPTFWKDDIMFWVYSAFMIMKHGYGALSKVVVTGQYYDQKGMYYGGQRLSPEHDILRTFLVGEQVLNVSQSRIRGDEKKENEKEKEENVLVTQRLEDLCGYKLEEFQKISLIDVHTGLGKKGVDTLLTSHVRDYRKLQQLFKNDPEYLQNDRIMCSVVPSGEGSGFSQQVMYAHSIGNMDEYSAKYFVGNERDTLSCTQEFGTIPAVQVFKALRNENMAYWYSQRLFSGHHTTLRVQSKLYKRRLQVRNAFYCETDPDWKDSVLRYGTYLFQTVWKR